MSLDPETPDRPSADLPSPRGRQPGRRRPDRLNRAGRMQNQWQEESIESASIGIYDDPDIAFAPSPGGFPVGSEGPSHEETIAHLYGLDECVSPVDEFISDDKKGELSLAEGMIWSIVLGPPKSRRSSYGKESYFSTHKKDN